MFKDSFINSNSLKEFSITEISNKIKELLESNLGYIRVKGEISGLKIASSGHGYLNLKENNAILACTCWRPTLAKIKFSLNDGMEVIVTGKLTGYSGQSRYQLSIENLEPAGAGAIMQILKERKERLEKEGLFNKIKKELPVLPAKIGVVTSITGAVIRDIIHRIADRCPSHIIIWPVTVQGENAGNEIAKAITGFNELESNLKPDIIIVARGGGSMEDLSPFNDEIVVRSTFNSYIPIISAVGHEVDYTLIDLVADKRAPTPTAAAEFAVPVISVLNYKLFSYYNALRGRVIQLIKYEQQTISHYDKIFKQFIYYIDYRQQHLDEFSFKLKDSLSNILKLKKTKFELFTIERLSPLKIVSHKLLELKCKSNYIVRLISNVLDNFTYKLNLNNSLLISLDYNNILKRGFTLIKSESGEFLPSKSIASTKEKLNIKFFDGDLMVSRELK